LLTKLEKSSRSLYSWQALILVSPTAAPHNALIGALPVAQKKYADASKAVKEPNMRNEAQSFCDFDFSSEMRTL
jgi:hypothetical protein